MLALHGFSAPADVLGHDGDALGLDGAQVGVFKQTNKVSLDKEPSHHHHHHHIITSSHHHIITSSHHHIITLSHHHIIILKSHHSRAVETQTGIEILSDFSHKPLPEGQLADQELGGLLVTRDHTKSDCTRPASRRLLHSTSGRSALTSCL